HTRLLLALVGITASLVVSPALAEAKETIEQCANGPTGTVELQFDGAVTRFANLDTAHRPQF
ncbi:MAG: hypothetical protein ACTHNN_16390, partial [Xanthobacteraceae bacterium]